MRERTGYVYQNKATGKWYARVCYKQTNGKRTSAKRAATSKSEARKALKNLLETLDGGGRKALQAEKVTFNDLCDYYAEHYLLPARYANNRKVAGLRSIATVKGYITVFQTRFGTQLLKSVTYDDLRSFRNDRLTTSTHQSAQRSLATVNREIAYLRRLFNIAERAGLLKVNPFRLGDPLIHVADEVKRERILTHEEEESLLAACVGVRAHLRPIIVAALDTGCRLRELLKLRWDDVDLENQLITIQAFNTKTMKQRQVSITNRLKCELVALRQNSTHTLVFGFSDVRASFNRARELARLDGLRFHDLRHTHATRLDDLGFSLAKIGAQLGHTVVQTTLRYVNRDKAAIQRVGSALDGVYAKRGIIEVSLTVN